jgi:hypothetical protein
MLINNVYKIGEDKIIKLSFVSVIVGPETYRRGILTIISHEEIQLHIGGLENY